MDEQNLRQREFEQEVRLFVGRIEREDFQYGMKELRRHYGLLTPEEKKYSAFLPFQNDKIPLDRAELVMKVFLRLGNILIRRGEDAHFQRSLELLQEEKGDHLTIEDVVTRILL